MEDLKVLLLKHNMTLNVLQTIRSFQRCVGAGLFGVLSAQEERVMKDLAASVESIEELCDLYYDTEERA